MHLQPLRVVHHDIRRRETGSLSSDGDLRDAARRSRAAISNRAQATTSID
jgi:hypothetical protein